MTDSSTEKPAEQPVVTKEEVKVPVAAIVKERAEKRAARAEATDLKQQLAEAKESNPHLDVDALMGAIGTAIQEGIGEALQKEVAPLRTEVENRKAAMSLGLTDQQAEVFFAKKAKVSGLSDVEILKLARDDNPKLFEQQLRYQRPVMTTISPNGQSQLRDQPEQVDHMALSNKAKAERLTNPNWEKEMKAHAETGFLEKINRARRAKNGGG